MGGSPEQFGHHLRDGVWLTTRNNALAESFFATLKCELLYTRSWQTKPQARSAIVHWIEAIYNRRRRHSSLGMLAPIVYEQQHQVQCNAA